MYQYKINKIKRIIDGDTIDVEIDLGFDVSITQRIRLKDVDTPEIRTRNLTEKEKGIEAKEWLEKELSREGDWMIDTFKEDKYGRILGILYREGDFVTVNQKLLNEEIARPYMS